MITDEDIRDVTEAFVQIANKTGMLEEVMSDYQDKRSLAIKIMGSRFKTGFIFKEGRIRMLSDLDTPTVTVTMDKDMYWNIINSESSGIARARIFTAVFTEESIIVDPPPGVSGGALHIENVIKVFNSISKTVMG
uniref:Uncharacterized protein n=1 Tax=viral metagenome TaxID=1070528 RepID=A0A6M3JXW0_9ZZZZ